MHLVGLSWSWSCKIHCSSHISPSSVLHHTGSLLYQQHQMRFSSVKKTCQPGLWNKCCFVLVVWSCLLEPSMKRFWQDKNSKVIFSEIQEPGPIPIAYIDPWTSFFFQQRSVLFSKDLWWLTQGSTRAFECQLQSCQQFNWQGRSLKASFTLAVPRQSFCHSNLTILCIYFSKRLGSLW